MSGTFEIKKTIDGKYSFNLKAANGQIILKSEDYSSMDATTNAIESVRKNSQIAEHFVKEVAADGSQYFALITDNGQIIGRSEFYASESSRDSAFASIRSIALIALLVLPTNEEPSYKIRNRDIYGQQHNSMTNGKKAFRFKHYGAFANDPGALELFDEIERQRDQRLIGG
jgi:uncharacterized protein